MSWIEVSLVATASIFIVILSPWNRHVASGFSIFQFELFDGGQRRCQQQQLQQQQGRRCPTSRRQRMGEVPMTVSNDDNYDANDDNPELYFDDFDGRAIGGGEGVPASSSSASQLLQQRFDLLRQSEQAQQQELDDNWKEGFWGVRGCSLDPFEAAANSVYSSSGSGNSEGGRSSKTIVTCMTKVPISALNDHNNDDHDHEDDDSSVVVLLVGRSDGSLVWLQVDTTPPKYGNAHSVVYFTNQPVARTTDDGGMVVGNELQPEMEQSDDGNTRKQGEDSPFSILAQLPPLELSAAVQEVLVLPQSQRLWVRTESCDPSQIVSYRLERKNTLDHDDDKILLPDTTSIPSIMDTPHMTGIMAMMPCLPNSSGHFDFAATVSSNGQIVVWRVESNMDPIAVAASSLFEDEDDMLSVEERIDSQGDAILSVDVSSVAGTTSQNLPSSVLVLGSQMGKIYVLSISNEPNNNDESTTVALQFVTSWTAFTSGSDTGVSAVRLAESTSGRKSNPASSTNNMVLVAGNLQGEIKQWELIAGSKNVVQYQHWPRMASQRLPDRAHVFQTTTTSSPQDSSSNNNDNSVRSILCLPQTVLTATAEVLTAWDPVTGKTLYQMQGLEFGNDWNVKPSLVVATDSMLITNGMDQYVCIHDFAMERVTEDNVQGYFNFDDEE